jgi:hypothetical protein
MAAGDATMVEPSIIYGFTQHPDKNIGREQKRHLLREGHQRTLCGHNVAWVWDYAIPLSPDCQLCLRVLNANSNRS